jgi:hypothetical protein
MKCPALHPITHQHLQSAPPRVHIQHAMPMITIREPLVSEISLPEMPQG